MKAQIDLFDEIIVDNFAGGGGYLRAEEVEMEQPSLFDLIEQEAI